MGIEIKVRKKFIVNGVEYDDESKLPPDVRAAFEQAMNMAKGTASGSNSSVKFTVHTSGPNFSFHAGSGAPPENPRTTVPNPLTRPIEPGGGASIRAALWVLVYLGVGVAIWYWFSTH
jgi:hypothetical protein